MANICRTNIRIEASEAAINYFREKYDNCNDGPYPNTKETPHIADVFGADAELFIDKVGSKWVQKYDVMDDDINSFEFSLESAWYPPSDMILEIYRQMAEIDDEVKISGKYWDEVYNPIGVFEVYYGEIIKEEHHDLDEAEWDEKVEKENEDYDRNFWDEVIDPLFTVLQKKLDKVMEEI